MSIKNKQLDESLAKESIKDTIQNTSEIFKNIIETIDSTVKDEELKNETLEIVKKINNEIDRASNRAKVKEINMVKKHVKTTKEKDLVHWVLSSVKKIK